MFKKMLKLSVAIQIALLVTMLFATPAAAAELRGYENVIIASGDVVDDDLYLAGNRIVINGTVNGDVLAAGETIIVNGIVNGDVLALGGNIHPAPLDFVQAGLCWAGGRGCAQQAQQPGQCQNREKDFCCRLAAKLSLACRHMANFNPASSGSQCRTFLWKGSPRWKKV